MKTTIVLISFLFTSASVGVTALLSEEFYAVKDTDAGSVYFNVSAHRRRDNSETFFLVSTNEHGTVYSNTSAHQRRDNMETFFPVSTNEHGTVYSNVAPTNHHQRDNTAYTPISENEVEKYLKEK